MWNTGEDTMTLSIMTLSIKGLYVTLNIKGLLRKSIQMALSKTDKQHNNALHYAECPYAKCQILFIVMLNVIMLNVIMQNAI